MTPKENYEQIVNGGTPEWVPCALVDFNIMRPTPCGLYAMEHGGIDEYGVKWTISPTDGMPCVDPKRKILDDIADWRDFIELPDLDSYDWAAMAEQDQANLDPDKPTVALTMAKGEVFMPIMNMMGFEDGLCAFMEDPDEVHALFEALVEYRIKMCTNILKYYDKIDTIVIGDDFASSNDLLVSYETFREMLLPYYKREFEALKPFGKYIEFHLCGKVDRVIDDLMDLGMDIWQSAQCMNDLHAIMEKYPNLAYDGVWDTSGPGALEGDTFEQVVQGIHETIDTYGATGRLMVLPGATFGVTDEAKQRFAWFLQECVRYGHEYGAKNFAR